jgi:Na+-driven multidrug efflux pump
LISCIHNIHHYHPGSNGFSKRYSSAAASESSQDSASASKIEMLKFAIPALGIYLTNPLLSNIDNAFVGRTVGPAGLAALSPATLCIDQALYLFSFLSRATTGMVSRAYFSKTDDENNEHNGGENLRAARDAASPAFSMSLICGAGLSLVYAFFTPSLLNKLNVDPHLRTSATSYIHWRGAISWAALAQSICLSLFMATKDSFTPLKIISAAALLNVLGDTMLCVWPLKGGCGGAAAATALATLISSAWMAKTLKDRGMCPRFKIPSKKELGALMEFTGPLLMITFVRMAGFLNMQRRAMSLDMTSLAGYQLLTNLLVFFILFGEPLSQIGQTQLPSLIDSNETEKAMSTYKSVMMLSSFAALGVGATAFLTATFGSGMFSSDLGVQAVARHSAPALFSAVVATILGIGVDGCMMASKDFGFMLFNGLFGFLVQAKILNYCTSISGIFYSFAVRLSLYTLFATGRTALGVGNLGKALQRGPSSKKSPIT